MFYSMFFKQFVAVVAFFLLGFSLINFGYSDVIQTTESVSGGKTCTVSNTYDYANGGGQIYGGILLNFDDVEGKYRFFISDGTLIENADGTADFIGTISHKGHSNGYLNFNIKFTGLVSSVDGTQAHYYKYVSGSMTGPTGSRYAGAEISVSGKAKDGYQAHIGIGKNYQEDDVFGGSFWFQWSTTQQPNTGVYLTPSAREPNGDFNFRLNCEESVNEAPPQSTEVIPQPKVCIVSNTYDYSHGDGQVYGGVLPRFDDINKKYRFVISNGTLTENADGTADFIGNIQHKGHSNGYLTFHIKFSGLVGSIDGTQTHYYSHVSGSIMGPSGSRYEGAIISVSGKNRDGYPVHLGIGKNYQEDNVFGGSFWFGWSTVQQPSTGLYLKANSQGMPNGDFNFRLNCEGTTDAIVDLSKQEEPETYEYPSAVTVSDVPTCIVSNTYDYSHGNGQVYGGVLPRFDDINKKYRFVILNGIITKNADGSANFVGNIGHKGHSNGYLSFSIKFTGPVDSVDGTQTHYYSHVSGSMTGLIGSRYEGARISISGKNRDGYPVHIGIGKNYQENDVFGGSFWFNWSTIQQPSTGVYFKPSSQEGPSGDFNFRLDCQ